MCLHRDEYGLDIKSKPVIYDFFHQNVEPVLSTVNKPPVLPNQKYEFTISINVFILVYF